MSWIQSPTRNDCTLIPSPANVGSRLPAVVYRSSRNSSGYSSTVGVDWVRPYRDVASEVKAGTGRSDLTGGRFRFTPLGADRASWPPVLGKGNAGWAGSSGTRSGLR